MLADGPVVLFFYPVAMTSVCTKESCHFRDMKAEYEQAGAQRVGISLDSVERQKQFSDKENLDYPLLADVGGTVAEQFGVKRRGPLAKLGPAKRKTFVIGTDRKIVGVVGGELNAEVHADDALKMLAAV